ncbi:MAG: hypothetical protein EOO43_12235 [Flavobacterium sp.]|nr:MAG: hypothetical protein EOO43_12235 [Flavobacterium sp.]
MFLQGEIKKLQAPYILETFKYFPLDGNYSPDLLMHTPSADDNAFVIEIKTQPNINMQLILHDLDKIGQFLNRFNYDCGIFLAVNSNPNELLEFLNSYIEYLMDKITLARFEHFHIIVKENYDSEIFHCTLFDILDQPFWNKFKTYS